MEKLEQVDMDCISALECAEFEVCVEEIETEPELSIQLKNYKKPAKSRLSKLFKRSMRNANNSKETIPIETLKCKRNYRIYGVF
jgi:hypothetical protein